MFLWSCSSRSLVCWRRSHTPARPLKRNKTKQNSIHVNKYKFERLNGIEVSFFRLGELIGIPGNKKYRQLCLFSNERTRRDISSSNISQMAVTLRENDAYKCCQCINVIQLAAVCERDTPGSDLGLEYLTATGGIFRLVGLRLGYWSRLS